MPMRHDIPPDPNNLTALLHRIGLGAAADGQPWPERHQLPGRCLALADSDGALAGLRIVNEILLAAERARQNGGPEHRGRPRDGRADVGRAGVDQPRHFSSAP